MDFAAAAKEVGIWIGAATVAGAAGVVLGYSKDRITKWYDRKFEKPIEPFEGIPTHKFNDYLPK
jgi:hypothetical protein